MASLVPNHHRYTQVLLAILVLPSVLKSSSTFFVPLTYCKTCFAAFHSNTVGRCIDLDKKPTCKRDIWTGVRQKQYGPNELLIWVLPSQTRSTSLEANSTPHRRGVVHVLQFVLLILSNSFSVKSDLWGFTNSLLSTTHIPKNLSMFQDTRTLQPFEIRLIT